jgi:hypothetical protein
MILKNIFAKKIGENIGVFPPNYFYFLQKYDHNIFLEKTPIFSHKIVENLICTLAGFEPVWMRCPIIFKWV